MSQNFAVPNIYVDLSNQYQGYFAFRFTCQECRWSIDTTPIRSNIATATSIMDVGAGLLGGFFGRAAEMGEKVYGSQFHKEQAAGLQKAWGEIQHHFHFCPKCHRTVCDRCFNFQVNLCTGSGCAPDLKADGTQFQHHLNIDAQRAQIQENYKAPQFNTNAIPSATIPGAIQQPQLPQPAAQGQALTPAGFNTPGYPKELMCPTCHRMGSPGKFCQDCGTKLPLPDLFCPKCAAPLENNPRFCSECGTKIQTT